MASGLIRREKNTRIKDGDRRTEERVIFLKWHKKLVRRKEVKKNLPQPPFS